MQLLSNLSKNYYNFITHTTHITYIHNSYSILHNSHDVHILKLIFKHIIKQKKNVIFFLYIKMTTNNDNNYQKH